MTLRPRTLFIAGITLLVLAGFSYGALRLLYGARPAYINVRWAPNVDEATQRAAERRHQLTPVEFRENRTWLYVVENAARDNIRSLVQNPAVEDTHQINRRTFTIAWSARRGPYASNHPAWGADLLEFLIQAGSFGGAAAFVLAGVRWWQARRAAPRAAASR